MNTTKTLIITALGLLGLASACSMETTDASAEDVGSGDEAVCSNEEGVNAAMAALVAATAKQIRRLEPQTDFKINYSLNGGTVELTSAGKNRCSDGSCRNVQAILDWQKSIYDGKIKFKGGDVLSPGVFRDRLKANLERQFTCNSQPDNHAADNCPAEKHDLVFSSANPGSCETDYWFHAYKAGTTTNLQYPAQLKNQLLWVGYQGGGGGNPYLAFDTQGDDVKIDPTGGPVEGDPAASGSCAAVCNKFSIANITNNCCSCNGSTGTTFQLAVAVSLGGSPYMYACR